MLTAVLALLAAAAPAAETDWSARARRAMVERIESYREAPVTDARVLAAMRKVPRHLFVPKPVERQAYEDRPLPIGEDQTISQPYIVALMSQALRLRAGERVLEVGTGSGYQAAVLAELGAEVYSIEIVDALARRAAATLAARGYKNVRVRSADGYLGWPERAPFNAIIVTCAPDDVPKPLVEQLNMGGRLVIPVGPSVQERPDAVQRLFVIRRTAKGLERESLLEVRFVPMTRKP